MYIYTFGIIGTCKGCALRCCLHFFLFYFFEVYKQCFPYAFFPLCRILYQNNLPNSVRLVKSILKVPVLGLEYLVFISHLTLGLLRLIVRKQIVFHLLSYVILFCLLQKVQLLL